MSAHSKLPENHPMMIAWRAYAETDEYANSVRWCKYEDYRNGSMWSAFAQGWISNGDDTAAALFDEIESLRAQLAEKEREWLPIETAPAMRTVLLFAVISANPDNWRMASGYFSEGDGAWIWDGRVVASYEVKPTHWMPLPAPPRTGE